MKDQVLSHDYTNTGGGCMVSTFQVWLTTEKNTVFVNVNQDSCVVARCDYINHEIEYSDDMVIDDTSIDCLTSHNDFYDLYIYCILEHVKRDYQHTGTIYTLSHNFFPDSWLQALTPEYNDWHLETNGDFYKTDGQQILIDEDYVQREPQHITECLDVHNCKKLLEYAFRIENEADNAGGIELEKFYNMKVVFGIGDRMVVVDNCAAAYNGLVDCLQLMIDEE